MTGGIPLLVEDGKNGFLVRTHDSQALAEKIRELLLDPARAAAFGKAGRLKIIKEFDWHERTASYNALLTQELGNGAPHIPRITVVASYFYPKIGGLENYAYLLAKNLHEGGEYNISIITSNYDGRGYQQEVIDGMTVHRLPIGWKISNTPVNILWYWQIKKIFAAEQPDIIHLHSPVPYMSDVAAWAAQERPIVVTYHSGSMLKNKWPIDIIVGLYENIFLPMLFRRANAIVAISQDFAKRKFPQFMEKTYFIPTGVDLGRFKKTPLPRGTDVVTFIGRIEHTSSWKGIEQLLQAMVLVIRHRPEAKLELVGGGDALGYYRQRAQELGIGPSVIFSGPQLGQKLVEAHQRASVIVLPSTSDSEAFSITLVEAMASGRPIIGTDIGGTPQVIDDGKNGLLVPPKDPGALAHAIERVLGDKELATHLADCGAERAQGFAWGIQAKKYSDLFKKIL
jgi:glycosyltransferase involved in cell wall biosynthesis